MKRYFTAFLTLLIMTTVTSTVNASLSPQCIAKIEATVQEVEKKSFQQVLNDGTWEAFKSKVGYPQDTGKWSEIVRTCVMPKPGIDCKGCRCGENDECTSACKCCWVGTTRC